MAAALECFGVGFFAGMDGLPERAVRNAGAPRGRERRGARSIRRVARGNQGGATETIAVDPARDLAPIAVATIPLSRGTSGHSAVTWTLALMRRSFLRDVDSRRR